jgi:hypothetical protein
MAGMDDWSNLEFRLYESLADQNPALYGRDAQIVQTIYDSALFNWDISRPDRAGLIRALRNEMWDQYGVDFDTVFDWEAYRAAYDEAN